MDKRYQVFVSSTFADLKEERQALMQSLLQLDHFPAGMELFPAANEDQWTLIKGVIDDSDYYVIVIGGRYGSTTAEGVSYTEMEFDYAIQAKKPVLAFVHNKPDEIPSGKTDQNDELRARLQKFKQKVTTGRLVRFWSSTMELQAALMQSIVTEVRRNPQEGWVRAGRAADPEALRILTEQITSLTSELEALSTALPAGSEDLCGGEDHYLLTVEYKEEWDSEEATHKVRMSWDHIFREVGPLLLHEGTEAAMRRRLAEEALFYGDKEEYRPGRCHEARLTNEDFDNVLVQLFALGLIRRGVAKRAIADKQAYWALTPFGEGYLMRLRALRRGEYDIEEEEKLAAEDDNEEGDADADDLESIEGTTDSAT